MSKMKMLAFATLAGGTLFGGGCLGSWFNGLDFLTGLVLTLTGNAFLGNILGGIGLGT